MFPVISSDIDIRQLRLSKWILPKTQCVSPTILSSQINLSASYFDAVEVLEVKNGYISSTGQVADNLFHTKHNIYLYTSADNSAKRRHIRNFWNKQSKSIDPLYICMIRLTDEPLDTPEIHDHICWALCDQAGIPKSKFLCYYSLDFCDLVLFAQGVCFSQYLAAIDMLNFCVQQPRERIVRDTISIYAIRPEVLAFPFPIEKTHNYKDKINVTLRLGVLDFSKLEQFYETAQKEFLFDEADPDIYCELSLGRSDFTLYAREKNYPWIIQLCKLLDRFTSSSDGAQDHSSGFLTFDISVGVDYKAISSKIRTVGFPPISSNRFSQLYLQAQKLETVCKRCQGLLKENSIDITFLSEVQLALTDLLKDGFAQDFVISICESFWHLCDYISKSLQYANQEDKSKLELRESVQNLLESYAGCLATIVNCTMHSDREFIQIPSFNMFLQSVPPKLLAFYTTIANQIAKYLTRGDQNESQFTFLFIPSYEDGINVKSLMPAKELDNRILAINIQENLLLSPKKLLPLIGHEIGHYGGRETREREFRTQCYLNSLLAYQLDRAFFSDIFGDESADIFGLCLQFANSLRDVIMIQRSQEFRCHLFSKVLDTVQRSHYLQEFLDDDVMLEATRIWIKILDHTSEMKKQLFVSKCIKKLYAGTQTNYLCKLWESKNSSKQKECLRIICEWCYHQITVPFQDNYEYDQLYNWYNWIGNAYRESYSDIVMLSLLKVTDSSKYNAIIKDNLIPNEDSEYNKLRVSAVISVLGGTDSRWMEMKFNLPAYAFKKCAFDQLAKYLKRCKQQLMLRLSEVDTSSLKQIYDKLHSNMCTAEDVFTTLRNQSQVYQEQLCMLPEIKLK